MKRLFLFWSLFAVTLALAAQTLNVSVGNVTYKFPAAQAGSMTYSGGTTLTIMGKTFQLTDITAMAVDTSSVTDNAVSIAYNGATATVVVAGNVAQYVEPTLNGAHVSIAQSADLSDENAGEITYTLSGSSTDGEFYLSGSYKSTVELNGLTLTNATPVNTGAAVHVQNGKRINIKVISGTVNTLTDAASGSQKGCLYVKGHAEIKQKGTLNIYANCKHGIKTGEYLTLKNATVNIFSAPGDGVNAAQYFLMESGTLNVSGVEGDGLQCDVDGDASTGETTDHDDEDSGNLYLEGGTIAMTLTGAAAKGLKAEGNIEVKDGDVTITNSGTGEWDSDDSETKAAAGLSSDANITISGGTLNLTSTGGGGKGIKCDSLLTVSGGTTTVTTSGQVYYATSATNYNANYTSSVDRLSSNYYSSPKGIKAGLKTQSGSSYTYAGGIVISGGSVSVTTSGNNAEGIESKNALQITGGEVTVTAHDDAINSANDLTISGGRVYAHGTNNDGIDANGNCYIQGGLVYAIGTSSPEVAIDANSEERKQLYVQGGTLVAIGGLESGASLTQSCYSLRSWNRNTWYALTTGGSTFLFKTPSSAGSTLVVSGSTTPTLLSGVTYTSGTSVFGGLGYVDAAYSGGSSVSLSSYSGGNDRGGGGGGPGGGGRGGR